jgi:hypothetical protein
MLRWKFRSESSNNGLAFPVRFSFIDSSRFISSVVSIVLAAFLIAHFARSLYEGRSILSGLAIIVGVAFAIGAWAEVSLGWIDATKNIPYGAPYFDPTTGKVKHWGAPELVPPPRSLVCPGGGAC